jgi:DNA-binding response OmpR family regulator
MNEKLLVIEDDTTTREGLEEYLSSHGYKVSGTGDGREGLNIALKEIPDLLLLDINLPSLDGIEVCRKLREGGFHNPVIILTTRSERIDKVVGLEVGADDYVTKPFDFRELLARIRTNLRRAGEKSSTSGSIPVTDTKDTLHRHLLAVMFSDMKDYSKKMNRNEKLALKLLKIHNTLMNESIKKFNGKVIEIIGDAFLASFESATDALLCCTDIQEKFRKFNLHKSKKENIKVRIGIHIGDLIKFEGKLKGDALNIAARIQQMAEPGSIYTSASFYLTVKGKTDTDFRNLGSFKLKNIKEQIQIYEVVF